MNRAWIPAGALASVSVAGLIALGPLTSSLNPPVNFTPSLTVATPKVANQGSVGVSVDIGRKGTTDTNVGAALDRGGAAIAAPATNGDAGQVGFKRSESSNSTAPATVRVRTSTAAAPKPKPKKPQRQSSIGADSGPTATEGLAGSGSSGSTSHGETSGTPAP
jgi:hypothetical protein